MHETGANIGFIISKHGLQSGAAQYTRHTNITGLTYLEFQERYFEVWWRRYFCPRIGDAADRLLQYTEEFNSLRDREYTGLSDEGKVAFEALRAEHWPSIMLLSMFNFHWVSPFLRTGTLLNVPQDLETFKNEVLSKIVPHIVWQCSSFRELLHIMLRYLADVEAEFNAIFGKCIFDLQAISGVGHDGPPLEDEFSPR